MHKKIAIWILSLVLALSLLTACGGPAESVREPSVSDDISAEMDEKTEEVFEEEPEETPAQEPVSDDQEPAAETDYGILPGTVWFSEQTNDFIFFNSDGSVKLNNPGKGAEILNGVFTWDAAAEEGTIAVGDVEGILYFANQYLSVEATDNAWFFEECTEDTIVPGN